MTHTPFVLAKETAAFDRPTLRNSGGTRGRLRSSDRWNEHRGARAADSDAGGLVLLAAAGCNDYQEQRRPQMTPRARAASGQPSHPRGRRSRAARGEEHERDEEPEDAHGCTLRSGCGSRQLQRVAWGFRPSLAPRRNRRHGCDGLAGARTFRAAWWGSTARPFLFSGPVRAKPRRPT